MRRGQFPGAYKPATGLRWRAYVWIDGEQHDLGYFRSREEASAYTQLVESRYPDRCKRRRGQLYKDDTKHRSRPWRVMGPRPDRQRVGYYHTAWEAERALAEWLSKNDNCGAVHAFDVDGSERYMPNL